jgi:hypothetical protein
MKFLAFVLSSTFLAGAALAEGATITVIGEGVVEAVPDMATVSLGVMAQADTAKAAMDETSEGVGALIDLLAGAGIEPSDIQTSGLSLNPLWDQSSYESGTPRVSGFQAMNTVSVRVRALDGLGALLDDALESGANMFNGLSFGLQEPGPRLDEARAEAVADARRKAELLAAAAGVELGGIVSIAETANMAVPMPMYRMDTAMSEAVPVAAGEMAVTAMVTITWRIAE